MKTHWLSILGICFGVFVVPVLAAPPLIQQDTYPEHDVLDVMRKVCDWQIANNYDAGFTWHYGALMPGITATAEATKEDHYMDATVAWAEKFNWLLRTRSRSGRVNVAHADDHCAGHTYLDLYLLDSPQAVRLADTQDRMDHIIDNPAAFDCGSRHHFWTEVYDWSDALFMAPPVWPRLTHITGNSIYIDTLHDMWMDSQNCLYNNDNLHDEEPPEYLWWRDRSYINQRVDGKKVFWSRGNGWVAGGLVRVLQFMPPTHPSRANYVTMLQDMSNALLPLQGSDGFWRSNLLTPSAFPNPETSGTAFFCYMMAYGVNQGLLDPAVYGPVIENAWNGMVDIAVHPDGKLGYVQRVAAEPGAATYNDTHVYAVGAFLMAGSEMYKYYQAQNPNVVDNFESYALYNPLKGTLSDTWKVQQDHSATAAIALDGIADHNLRINYDNAQSPYMAEAYREFSPAKDFTNSNHVLTFYLKGQTTNAADELYCILVDINDQTAVQRITDTTLIQSANWVQVNLDLNEFTSIDRTQIKRLVFGVGSENPTDPAGAGTVWIDEITLSPRKSLTQFIRSDFDDDGEVNLVDFARIAAQWLIEYGTTPQKPDPAHLTAHWAFDETSGSTAYDSTAHGRDSTLFGATFVPNGGRFSGAVSINGESSNTNRIEMPASAINLAQGTYSMWFFLNPDQSTQRRYLWGHTTLPAYANRIQLYMDSFNTNLNLGMGNTHGLDNNIETLATETWYHAAVTWDGAGYQVYVNGQLKTSGAYAGLTELQSIAHIGNNGNDDGFQAFHGLIDEVRLYDIVLNDEEIVYLAQADTVIQNPLLIDLEPDGIIDINDLVLFVSDWLADTKWP